MGNFGAFGETLPRNSLGIAVQMVGNRVIREYGRPVRSWVDRLDLQ